MKIYAEKSLRDFEFWGGAKDIVKYLTAVDFDEIEFMLEGTYSEGLSETEINDIFCFDVDIIAEWLNFENFEALASARS